MSAQRFGGAHSPGGDPRPQPGRNVPSPQRQAPAAERTVERRTFLLFLLPTPLLLAAFGAMMSGDAMRLAVFLVSYACLMLAAWLLREGQRAQAAFDARTIARPPAFPRKLCAAGLSGIGVFLGAWLGNTPDGVISALGTTVQAAIFGALTVAMHLLTFGIDPMKAKGGSSSIHQNELDRVTDALEKAEDKLQNIERLAGTLRDREIDSGVRELNATVRDMISLVERDPRDLSRARRYLGVYLKGAEDATSKYAANHERLKDPKLREEYLSLLSDLKASFSRGRETLLLDDRVDLEVEIEVLRDRLGQEST